MMPFRKIAGVAVLLISGIAYSNAQGTFIDFSRIPKSGTVLINSHMDDDLIWMLPFWEITEKFIEGAMPVSPSYRTIVSQQQSFLNDNGYNIQYRSNWSTPWDDVTDQEYTGYYLSDNPAYSYLLNDHLEVRLYNNYTELSRFEINKLKAKLEQYIASPDMERAITHNNWGEYGHRHHMGINKAVRELAVKYRKDVWMLGCDNGSFRDVTVPNGITYTLGSFNDSALYLGIRTIYENNGRWTWFTDRVPSGDHKFIKVVDRGSDKSYILKGDDIEYSGPSQLEPGAYIFDGEDDYLTLKGNNYPSFTISMRIRPDVIREMDISEMSEYPGSGKYDRNIFLNSDGKLSARIYDGSSKLITSDAAIKADRWSHIAITGNGSSFRLYVNGILENSVTSGTAITNYSTPELVLGLATETGSNFKGQINGVAMYSRALSDSEITALSGGILYTITAGAGSGGSVKPSGSVKVAPGADKTFAIIPDAGYGIRDVKVDNVSRGAVSTYTFTNITADHSISARFEVIKYSLVAESGTGGSISPHGNLTPNYGTNRTFSITPDDGYNILDVRVDDASVGKISSYTFENITEDHTIFASFAHIIHIITGISGQGGSISPKGETAVNQGADVTCTIAPETGYLISDVKVDGVSKGKITSYKFRNVVSSHSISATFTPIILTVKGSSNPGGSIQSSGNSSVSYGTDLVYTITPDVGYQIEDVLVDGKSVGPVSTYTFSNINRDHTISVSFKIITFKISGSSVTGGSISPGGDVLVNYGTEHTYTIAADSAYKILDVTVDGVSVGPVTEYTFQNVTASHSIAATFIMMNTYTISSRAGAGGRITPSGTVKLTEGSDQSYTIIPDYGFRINEVDVDNLPAGTPNEYTFTDLVSDHNISVTFTTTTDVNVYPNPFVDEIKINIACPGGKLFDLNITDLNGKLVCTRTRIPGNTITTLNLQGPGSMYILRVYFLRKKIATFRLIRY